MKYFILLLLLPLCLRAQYVTSEVTGTDTTTMNCVRYYSVQLAENPPLFVVIDTLRYAATIRNTYANFYQGADTLVVDCPTAETEYTLTRFEMVPGSVGNNITYDSSDGTITLGIAGVYDVSIVASFSASKTGTVHLRLKDGGGSNVENVIVQRTIGNASDVGSATARGLVTATAGESFIIAVEASAINTDVSFEHLSIIFALRKDN